VHWNTSIIGNYHSSAEKQRLTIQVVKQKLIYSQTLMQCHYLMIAAYQAWW
jgi:hypothetical protein